jgi:hypothetical protein
MLYQTKIQVDNPIRMCSVEISKSRKKMFIKVTGHNKTESQEVDLHLKKAA